MKNIKLILLVIVFIAVGAITYFYKFQNGGENQVFCTQEALLCPDGSYIGRHGDKCAFSSCPNAGPFEGKLEQSASGFRLIMGSPDMTGQEVTYALPLEVKVSNALADLVGKKVRAFGVFGEGIIFKVDRLENAGDVLLGEVGVGETVFINGVRITLNKIISDSRCPVGVQCVWAGSVIASVTLKSDTDSETVNIESGKTPVPLDTFLISIEDVMPVKVAAQEPDPQSYVLTFKVVTR